MAIRMFDTDITANLKPYSKTRKHICKWLRDELQYCNYVKKKQIREGKNSTLRLRILWGVEPI